MATEEDVPESISATQRVGENIYLASRKSDKTVHETSSGELKKFHETLNLPCETAGCLEGTENMQEADNFGAETINTVIKGNVETPEGERFLESPSVAVVATEETCMVSKHCQADEESFREDKEMSENKKQMQNNTTNEIAQETGRGENEVVEESEEKVEKNNRSHDIVHPTGTSLQVVKIEESNVGVTGEGSLEEKSCVDQHVEVNEDQQDSAEDKSTNKETGEMQTDGTETDGNTSLESNKQVLNTIDGTLDQNKEASIHIPDLGVISSNKDIETAGEPSDKAESIHAKFTGEGLEKTSSEIDDKEAEKSINLIGEEESPEAIRLSEGGPETGEELKEVFRISCEDKNRNKIESSERMEQTSPVEDEMNHTNKIDTGFAVQTEETCLQEVDPELLKVVPRSWSEDINKENPKEVKEKIETIEKAEEGDSTSNEKGKDYENPEQKEESSFMKEGTSSLIEVLVATKISSGENRDEGGSTVGVTEDSIDDTKITDGLKHNQNGESNREERSDNLQQNEPEMEKLDESLSTVTQDFSIDASTKHLTAITCDDKEAPIKSQEESFVERMIDASQQSQSGTPNYEERPEQLQQNEPEKEKLDGSTNLANADVGTTASTDCAETIPCAQEKAPIKSHEESFAEKMKEDLQIHSEPIIETGIPKNKNVPEIEMNEKIDDSEAHVSNKDADDLQITYPLTEAAAQNKSKDFNKISNFESEEQTHEAYKASTGQKHIEDTPEACTISEHTSTEKVTSEPISTSETDMTKLQEVPGLDSEENSMTKDSSENKDQEMKTNEEVCHTVTHEILAKGDDAIKDMIDAEASPEVNEAIFLRDEMVEQKLHIGSPLPEAPTSSGEDETYKQEDNAKTNNITNQQVHDETNIEGTREATNEQVTKGIVTVNSLELTEQEPVESSQHIKNEAEKSEGENNSEQIIDDNIGGLVSAPVEQDPVKNLNDEKKKAEKSTGEVRWTVNQTPAEASPEEKRNEDNKSYHNEPVNAKDNIEKKPSESEEDLQYILQKKKSGEKLEESLPVVSNDTELFSSSADKIHCLIKEEAHPDLEETTQKEEKVNETDEKNETRDNKIAMKEDHKLVAETSDASTESIVLEPKSETDKMVVEDDTKKGEYEELYKDSKSDGECTEKQNTIEECVTPIILPEPVAEKSLKSFQEDQKEEDTPEIELYAAEPEVTSACEDAGRQIIEEENTVDQCKELEVKKTVQSSEEDTTAKMSKQDNDTYISAESIEQETEKSTGEDHKLVAETSEASTESIVLEPKSETDKMVVEDDTKKGEYEELYKDSGSDGEGTEKQNTIEECVTPSILPEPVAEKSLKSFQEDQKEEDTPEIELYAEPEVTSACEDAGRQIIEEENTVDQCKELEVKKTVQSSEEDTTAKMSKQDNDTYISVESIEQETEKSTGEVLENSETAKAVESIAHETSKTTESPKEILDTSPVKQEENLLCKGKITEASLEEKKNEDISPVIVAEENSDTNELVNAKEDYEADLEHILQKNEPASENLEETAQTEEKTEENNEAKHNKIAMEEDLKVVSKTSEASKSIESIVLEPKSELDKIVVEDDTRKGESEEVHVEPETTSIGEDTEQKIMTEESTVEQCRVTSEEDDKIVNMSTHGAESVEQETIESSQCNINNGEESAAENNKEYTIKDSNIRGFIPESVEQDPVKNLNDEKMKAEKSSETAEAAESIAHETIEASDIIDTSPENKRDNLQSKGDNMTPTDTSPEEKRTEDRSLVIVAQENSTINELHDAKDNIEKNPSKTEEYVEHISQKNETGEKLDQSLSKMVDETEAFNSNADQIPQLMEEGAPQNEEAARNNKEMEQNNETKDNKIAVEEDLKVAAETSDASKSKESKALEPTSEMDEIVDGDDIKNKDSEELSEDSKDKGEDTEKQNIVETCHTTSILPEHIGEKALQSFAEEEKEEETPKIEIREITQTVIENEDTGKQNIEEGSVAEINTEAPVRETDEEDSLKNKNKEKEHGEEVDDATLAVGEKIKAKISAREIVSETLEDRQESNVASHHPDVAEESEEEKHPKEIKEELVEKPVLLSEALCEDSKEEITEKEGTKFNYSDSASVTVVKEEAGLQEAQAEDRNQEESFGPVHEEEGIAHILENSKTAEAAESIAHETTEASDIIDTSPENVRDNLQSEGDNLTPTDTSPEEKRTEDRSLVMVAQENSSINEPLDAKDNIEKNPSKTEEYVEHIAQKNETGENLDQPVSKMVDETEAFSSNADQIPQLMEEGAPQNEEAARNNEETEQNNETKDNKIAVEEDLKVVAETSDASKSKESIALEPKSEMDEIVDRDDIKNKDSEELSEDSKDKGEDTEKQNIVETCHTTGILPEPIGENALQSFAEEEKDDETPKIEMREITQMVIENEDTGKQNIEEGSVAEINTEVLVRETDEEDSLKNENKEKQPGEEVDDATLAVGEKIEAKISAREIVSETLEDRQESNVASHHPDVAEESEEEKHPKEIKEELVEKPVLLSEALCEDSKEEITEKEGTKFNYSDSASVTVVKEEAGLQEAQAEDRNQEESFGPVHEEEGIAHILENSKTAEAAESIAHETTEASDIIDTSPENVRDNLQSEGDNQTPTDTSPEEKRTEDRSLVMVAQENSSINEPLDAKDNIEKNPSKTEEYVEHIAQKNETGEKLDQSLSKMVDETEAFSSNADQIPQLMEEGSPQNEEAARNNKETEQNNETKDNKIAVEEDLKVVAETSDASKSKESIALEPKSEMDEIVDRDDIKNKDSEELSEDSKDKGEDTEKQNIVETCHTTSILPEHIGEKALQSFAEEEKEEETPKIEIREITQTVIENEDTGKQNIEEGSVAEINTEAPVRETDEEDSLKNKNKEKEHGEEVDDATLAVGEKIKAKISAREIVSETLEDRQESNVASHHPDVAEESEEEKHPKEIKEELVEKPVLLSEALCEDSKEEITEKEGTKFNYSDSASVTVVKEEAGLQEAQAEDRNQEESFGPVHEEEGIAHILENSKTAEAAESIAHETTEASDIIDTSPENVRDNLQSEGDNLTPTDTSPEEKRTEDRSLVMVAQENSSINEPLDAKDNIEKNPSKTEEYVEHIAQKNETGENLDQPVSKMVDETEAFSSNADQIPQLMEEGCPQNEEAARNIEETEQNNETKDNKIAVEEDLKVVAETSDASKSKESIALDPKSEMDEIVDRDDIKNKDSEELSEDSKDKGEDTEKQNIVETCHTTSILPEHIGEKALQSFAEEEKEEETPKIEIREITQTVIENEDTGKQNIEEGSVAEINTEALVRETDEEDSIKNENLEKEHGEEADDATLAVGEKIEATSSAKETVSEPLKNGQESNVASHHLDVAEESEEEKHPKEVKEELVEKPVLLSEALYEDSKEEITEKEEAGLQEAQAEDRNQEESFGPVHEEEGIAETETREIAVESGDMKLKPEDTSNLSEMLYKDIPVVGGEDRIDKDKQNEVPRARSENPEETTTNTTHLKETLEDELIEYSTVASEELKLMSSEERETADETPEIIQAPDENKGTTFVAQAIDEMLMQKHDNTTNPLNVSELRSIDTEKETANEAQKQKVDDLYVHPELENDKDLRISEDVEILKRKETRELTDQSDIYTSKTLQDAESSDLGLKMEENKDEKALKCTESSSTCTEIEKAIIEQEISEGNLHEGIKVEKTAIEQKEEAYSQRHEDTCTKDDETITEENSKSVDPDQKFEFTSESVAEDQSKPILSESDKSKIEENDDNKKYHDEKEIKEKEEPTSEAKENIERNANEITKAVIFTEKAPGGVKQLGDIEDIKEPVIEKEQGIDELHGLSTVGETTNQVKDSTLVCCSYAKVTESKEKTDTENSEVGTDSTRQIEASFARQSEEQKLREVSIETPAEELEEKKKEKILEESKDCCSKNDDETMAITTAEKSSEQAKQVDKLLKASNIDPEPCIETSETENSHQNKETDIMKLEETSSHLTSNLLTVHDSHAEQESIPVENTEASACEETKIASEAFYGTKDQCTEETDIGKTVEKKDQVQSYDHDHAEKGNATLENSDKDGVEETKIASAAGQGTEGTSEIGKSPTVERMDQVRSTNSEHAEESMAVENPKANEVYESKVSSDAIYISKDHGTEESAGKTSTVEIPDQVPVTNSEHAKNESVSEENPDADDADETKMASNVVLKSDEVTKDIDEIRKSPTAEKQDAYEIEEACKVASDSRAHGGESVREDEITTDQTMSTEKLEEHLPALTSATTTTATIEKIEEKTKKVDILEDEGPEDLSVANLTEDTYLQQEVSRELDVSTVRLKINKDTQDSPTEVHKEEGQKPDAALQLEQQENNYKIERGDSASESKNAADLTGQAETVCDIKFETSEKTPESDMAMHNHGLTESEDTEIKEKHLVAVITDMRDEEKQLKEMVNESLQDELKAEECVGEKTNTVYINSANAIQNEELSVSTASKNIEEQVATEDRSVQDPEQVSVVNKIIKESFPNEFEAKDAKDAAIELAPKNQGEETKFGTGKTETTTPREEEFGIEISQKENLKGSVNESNLIEDIQELENNSCATTEKQIPAEADLIGSPKTIVSTGNECAPSVLHEGITEVGDFEPGHARGVHSEAKGIEHEREKISGDSEEETIEKTAKMDTAKASLSALLQTSRKETPQVVEHVIKERELTVSPEELQTEQAEIIQIGETKTGEEKDEEKEDEEHKKTDLSSDALVLVDVPRDMDVKVAHKKSHGILSGVGSKVKHSISKVKKAITGKSSHHPKPVSPK